MKRLVLIAAALVVAAASCSAEARIVPGDTQLSPDDYVTYMRQITADSRVDLVTVQESFADVSGDELTAAVDASVGVFDTYLGDVTVAVPPDVFREVHVEVLSKGARLRAELANIAQAARDAASLPTSTAYVIAVDGFDTACRDLRLAFIVAGYGEGDYCLDTG